MRIWPIVLAFTFGCKDVAVREPRSDRASAPRDAAVGGALDAADEPVGAVPLPGEHEVEHSINHLDRSVKIEDLPGSTAAWKRRTKIEYRGRVAIALHIAGHERVELTVVDTVTETPTGYPGTLADFPLGTADTTEQPSSGNAFPARDANPETGEYVGPVMFAVRLLPRTGAPERERRQYAVYAQHRTIFVADKLVTEAAWTPRLRIDAPNAKELVAINPGWH